MRRSHFEPLRPAGVLPACSGEREGCGMPVAAGISCGAWFSSSVSCACAGWELLNLDPPHDFWLIRDFVGVCSSSHPARTPLSLGR